MTFANRNTKWSNSLIKLNSYNPNEDNSKQILNSLQEAFIKFEKNYDSLNDYNKRLPSLTEKEYLKRSLEAHSLVSEIKTNLSDINNYLGKLESMVITDKSLQESLSEIMKTINKKIQPKQNNLDSLIKDILNKEGDKNLSLGVSLKSRISLQHENSFQNNKEPIRDKELNEQLLIKGNIEIKDLEFTEQVLNDRKAELEEIQKISAQMRELTHNMQDNVYAQGEKLSKIILIYKVRFFGR